MRATISILALAVATASAAPLFTPTVEAKSAIVEPRTVEIERGLEIDLGGVKRGLEIDLGTSKRGLEIDLGSAKRSSPLDIDLSDTVVGKVVDAIPVDVSVSAPLLPGEAGVGA